MAKLTVKAVSSLKDPGMYSDESGLYLCVGRGGAKSWVFRSAVKGRKTASGAPYRVEVGLGSATSVTLAEAREVSRKYHKAARAGTNPLDLKHRESITFEDAAQQVFDMLRPNWRNAKHAETWLATIKAHANPVFGKAPIESVTTGDVMRVLAPIWTEKHETATRLSQRLATILDWAKGKGLYPHENPVNGIKRALPQVKRRAEHLAAMPWRELPVFMAQLNDREGISARALEFIVLTASRSGEVRGARWEEIDLAAKVWNVPADRMKRKVPHRVPLSPEALLVLEAVRGLDGEFLFPSVQRGSDGKGKPMSVMVFKALFKRMDLEGFTTHGFR
ncbi:MAG: integrase arm-type DNA-binding domain-containing protein, partial [Albidovulum sp.]